MIESWLMLWWRWLLSINDFSRSGWDSFLICPRKMEVPLEMPILDRSIEALLSLIVVLWVQQVDHKVDAWEIRKAPACYFISNKVVVKSWVLRVWVKDWVGTKISDTKVVALHYRGWGKRCKIQTSSLKSTMAKAMAWYLASYTDGQWSIASWNTKR